MNIKKDLLKIMETCNLKGLIIKLKNKYPEIYDKIIKHQNINQLKTVAESIFWIINDIKEHPTCIGLSDKCTNPKLKFKNITHGYSQYCIKCCTLDENYQYKYKQTMLKKYGVDNPMKIQYVKDKIKNNNIEKYGVESTNQIEIVKNKKIKSYLKNLNYDNPNKNKQVQLKKRNTCLQKYGKEFVLQVEEIIDKRKSTCINKYNESNWMKTDEAKNIFHTNWLNSENKQNQKLKVIEFLKERDYELLSDYININTPIKIKCLKCNFIFEEYWTYEFRQSCYCPNCEPAFHNRSRAEQEISKLFNNYEIIENSRKIIPPYELDIYIPSLNLAIEYNGLRYHSSGGNDVDKFHVPYNYHLNKLNLCNKKNIFLITIFEDEWILKKDIITSKLKILTNQITNKIYARKCKIKELTFIEKKEFLDNYHLQGNSVSSINLGLQYENELIACMTFSKRSLTNNQNLHCYELTRFCCKNDIIVVGGASKLLTYFKNNFTWNELISYCDKRWSIGNIYEKLGFIKISESAPNYWYWGKDIIGKKHRLNYRKTLLKNMNCFDENLSEKEIMRKEGYNWIYDCGNYKFMMKNIEEKSPL